MFGTVRPCYELLERQQTKEYRRYYCGLCMGMGRCAGLLSRLLVNYDMSVAYLVADSVSPGDTACKRGICPFSPLTAVEYYDNAPLLDKLSRVNYLLAYHKALDDAADDGGVRARLAVSCMRTKYALLASSEPATDGILEKELSALRAIENPDVYIPLEQAALPFGRLLCGVLADCLDDSADSRAFGVLCKRMGMWIYAVDACLDLREDEKKGRYNPLLAGTDLLAGNAAAARKAEIADFLVQCRQAMFQLLELLNCTKNTELIHSIFEHALPREVADLLK